MQLVQLSTVHIFYTLYCALHILYILYFILCIYFILRILYTLVYTYIYVWVFEEQNKQGDIMQLSQLSTVCVSSFINNIYNQILCTTQQMQPVWSSFHCCGWTEETHEWEALIFNAFFPLTELLSHSLSQNRHSAIKKGWFYQRLVEEGHSNFIDTGK